MELRESLRMLRSELGMTQSEFANAVNVGFTAASRWENKNIRPNRSSSIAIIKLAKKNSVSPLCLNNLTEILFASRVKDKIEREQAAQLKERLQLEDKIILTDEIMKTMLNNIDIAIVGHRVFFNSLDETKIIYYNAKYIQIFDYSKEEFEIKSKENIFFSVPKESIIEYKKQVKRLLNGEIKINEFNITMRGFRRDKTIIWLEIKGVSIKKFSYGWDFFLSCLDVSKRVEAQRKYVEEIAIRNASLQNCFASIHIGLITNKVFRQNDIDKITNKKFLNQNVDTLLKQITDSIQTDNKKELREKISREYLIKEFNKDNSYFSMQFYNTVCKKWIRYSFAIIENPYTNNLESMVYMYDIHAQVIALKIMKLIANQYYDYIGIINKQNKTFESFYYAPLVYKFTVSGERNYKEVIEKKFNDYAPKKLHKTQMKAIELETITEKLDKSDTYSVELHLLDYEKNPFIAKVTYRYLDETKTNILMAQHKNIRDLKSLSSTNVESEYCK